MKKSKCPTNWLEAFFLLSKYLEEKDNGSRQVIFLDELPWLDTPRSGFITAFEGFGTHGLATEAISCSFAAVVPTLGCSTI